MKPVSITRKKLYEKVWSKPMREVAKDFGISDVGLKKVCRRHNVVCPPQGYWNKKAAGHNPIQLPLSNPNEDNVVQFQGGPPGAELNESLKKQISDQKSADFKIDFKGSLRGAHALVVLANEKLQSAKVDRDGCLIAGECPLEIRATRATFGRALRIMDAVIRAFELRKYTVSAGPCLVAFGIKIQFRIVEKIEARNEKDDSLDLSGRYVFGYDKYKTTREPTGRLTLEVVKEDRYWLSGVRYAWRDNPTQALDSQLNDVCAGLITFAANFKQEEDRRRSRA